MIDNHLDLHGVAFECIFRDVYLPAQAHTPPNKWRCKSFTKNSVKKSLCLRWPIASYTHPECFGAQLHPAPLGYQCVEISALPAHQGQVASLLPSLPLP